MSVLNLKHPICQRSSACVVRRRMVANDTYICCLFWDSSLLRRQSVFQLPLILFYTEILRWKEITLSTLPKLLYSYIYTGQFRKVRWDSEILLLKISMRSVRTWGFPVSTLIARLCTQSIKLIWMVRGRSKRRCLNSSL